MNEDRLYGIDALVKIAEVLTGLSKDELGEFTLDELITIIDLELHNNIASINIALARIEQEEGLK